VCTSTASIKPYTRLICERNLSCRGILSMSIFTWLGRRQSGLICNKTTTCVYDFLFTVSFVCWCAYQCWSGI
jgi:hypothetical protein